MTAVARRSVARWTATLLYRAGLLRPLALATGYARRSAGFQILIYHRVNDDRDPFFPSMPTEVFDRHMAYVARTYRVLTVEALVERMRCGRVPRNALAITFDDGYRDTLTHAAPILARYKLPATVFLATGFVGTAKVPWVDQAAMAFKTTPFAGCMAPWGEPMDLQCPADRLGALQRTLQRLKRLPDDDTRQAVDGLLNTLGARNDACFKNLMLSWGDVHALMGLGFSIGAHTVNHPILSRVPLARAWREILGSRTMIQSACGRAPQAFAYPNGRPEDYTDAVASLVREAGFTCAVTTRFGLNTIATPPYELSRGGPWEQDVASFAMKLAAYRVLA